MPANGGKLDLGSRAESRGLGGQTHMGCDSGFKRCLWELVWEGGGVSVRDRSWVCATGGARGHPSGREITRQQEVLSGSRSRAGVESEGSAGKVGPHFRKEIKGPPQETWF